MRTPSQLFADALNQKNPQDAARLLLQYGGEEVNALWWLAIQPHGINQGLLEYLQSDKTITPKGAGRALLMGLAQKNNWDVVEPLVTIAIARVDREWWARNCPLHHASFYGNHGAFDMLEQTHKKLMGQDFDWNTPNQDNHTPLFLALSETHLDTTVSVLQKGGSANAQMPSATNPGKTVSVLSEVLRKKHGVLGYIKQIWAAANDKAAMDGALRAVKTPKPERKKKM